ncbi:hypothetical protein ROHU_030935 [Labeo rohita]|uniref:Uncharacterized protein n=1 Tax=Labeo rohita TaxID=84645 RepID=A0A498LPY0_LABRO|nr:hypothetical protein ROHU_030935 [Labeo rohita]
MHFKSRTASGLMDFVVLLRSGSEKRVLTLARFFTTASAIQQRNARVRMRLRRYNSAPIFSFSEAFNLRSGIGLAFPHTLKPY